MIIAGNLVDGSVDGAEFALMFAVSDRFPHSCPAYEGTGEREFNLPAVFAARKSCGCRAVLRTAFADH
jgi:hypothetical protein